MTQGNQSINSHIETYLHYYCGLSHAPGFAILLKGQWGSGKTRLINKYRKKLKQEKKKCLYVSLYGMTSFSEIEDTFFQQLHPVLSSKGMAITGKILKGFLKGTLKIDLDGDTKDDGAVNIQIPEINLPEYLKNTDKSILIFDDLERCQIDIGNLLGYINYFVEHQELKVILVANEDKLLDNSNYKDIKEKLIGKTFDVCLNLHGALKEFIKESNNSELENFLSNNTELIEELYQEAEYKNLRSLKQIVLDFERIFENLPDKAKNKTELLQDLLKLLMAFSIEIKRGNLFPKNISKLEEAQIFQLTQARRNYYRAKRSKNDQDNLSIPSSEDNTQELTSLKRIIDRYTFLNLLIYSPFLSLAWWQKFFDKGIINTCELKESILNSKYFQDENTLDWVRLYHFYYLADNEFTFLLKKVELQYVARQFKKVEEIKHIVGLCLRLSDIGLFCKSKESILQNAKYYIDWLQDKDLLELNIQWLSNPSSEYQVLPTNRLSFQGKELPEFQEFCAYIDKVRESARLNKMPELAEKLLFTMQNDVWQFYRMICLNNFQSINDSHQIYFEIPIFKYIEANYFIEKFFSISFEDQRTCFDGLKKRYEFENNNKKLVEELEWLKDIQDLLLEEAARKKGKLSGYRLELLSKEYLNKAIEKLEIS